MKKYTGQRAGILLRAAGTALPSSAASTGWIGIRPDYSIVAKNAYRQRCPSPPQMKERHIHREYLAVVQGLGTRDVAPSTPPSAANRVPLSNGVSIPVNGDPAVTHFTRMAISPKRYLFPCFASGWTPAAHTRSGYAWGISVIPCREISATAPITRQL